jgi:GDP-L-fucose synthase
MQKNDKIYIAGHRGLVGSSITRKLKILGYNNLILKAHTGLDLTNQQETFDFFKKEKPDYVFLAAARVGGILANSTYKAEFIYNNIMIAANVIEASFRTKVKKLLNLGSSCIFPKQAPQPLKEEYLLSGFLEKTNEPYAVAKITAIKLCRYYNEQYGTNYISVMPCNLYGPHDNFDLKTSHVLPALIVKIHYAKQRRESSVVIWGDGSPEREFLYVDDLADASIYLMSNYNYTDLGEFINVGTGKDISIKDLAELIAGIIVYSGKFVWDTSMPNGTPKKLLDISHINNLGWYAHTSLHDGIKKTYQWYCEEKNNM